MANGVNLNTTAISTVKLGTSQVDKIYRGTDLVWQAVSWQLQTGNFYTMTTNTAPTPFIASLLTGVTAGSAFQVFDNAAATGISANYFAASTTGLGAKILFGSSIRISKMKVRGNRSGQANWTCTVYGIKEDDTDVLVHSATVAVNSDVTINSSDTTTVFKGLKVFIDTRADLIVNLYTCQVSEWYALM